jgi:hypothetical protein
VRLTRAGDQELPLLPRKSDGPIWHSGLSNFSVLGLPYSAGGRHVHNGRLLHKILHSQNLQQVLTIPGGRASTVEPKVCTTLPKVDKAGTSSMDVPMAQTLVAQLRGKAPDGNRADDDPGLLNFTVAESEIICRMSSRL